jgi:hypothetical protein
LGRSALISSSVDREMNDHNLRQVNDEEALSLLQQKNLA